MASSILVTGGTGQVGQSLARRGAGRYDLVMPGRAELDLADPIAIEAFVASRPWRAIVSAAAYTAVDKAESDVPAAWAANALGPATLAAAAARAAIPIVHLSTDYVFDGTKPAPYDEADPVAPVGVYGASKEGGEQAVRTANPAHVILRTAWVVSPFGANFVKTMLRLGAERPKLGVVADQLGCPTSALDIADAVLAILDRIGVEGAAGPWGTYHFVNAGEATWHGLATHVFARAATGGRPMPDVAAIATADYPTPARRPANSRLSTARLAADYGIAPQRWEGAIDAIVDELIEGRTHGGATT